MNLLGKLRDWLRGGAPRAIRVRVLMKGRIGPGWHSVDQRLTLAAGATLATLIEEADRRGLGLSKALEESPHLRHTLMCNGERAPIPESLARPMSDGDEVYLLGPLAGG